MVSTVLAPTSEPEYGCEHLKAFIEDDQEAANEFFGYLHSFHKTKSWKPVTTHNENGSKPLISLKPLYRCLRCPMVGLRAARAAHRQETGHMFFIDCRTKSMFCHGCNDFIYDVLIEKLIGGNSDEKATRKRKLDDFGEESYSYITSNTNKKACGREGVRGLFNLGQTCYMNVILQTLFHEPVLTAYFLGNGHCSSDCQKQNCFGCGLADAFAEFNNEEKEDGFGTLNLLLALWQSSSDLAGYQQQDAHEFYQLLVDRLHVSAHNPSTKADCNCFFHNAFYGKLRSTVTCGNCGNASKTEDPILDVSLDLQVQKKKRALGGDDEKQKPTPTLLNCLEGYVAPEQLEPSEYDCGKCGSHQIATKELRLKKLPVVLCMQLKRFERIKSVNEKVDTKVSFPLALNMAPYTTLRDTKSTSEFQYDLLSVVVHIGDLDSGHYLTYCRQGDQWYKFNDDRVTIASESDVLAADAYLLFYTLHEYTPAKNNHSSKSSESS